MNIVRNKYLNALLLVFLGSAIVHVLILLGVFLVTLDWHVLNYFRILEIGYFFAIPQNTWSTVLSLAVFALVYLAVLFLNRNSNT